MYDSIPAVAYETPEPISTIELEDADVRFLYVPITEITFWEHHGFHRAHAVDSCINSDGLAVVCMYELGVWKEWCDVMEP